MCFLASTLPLSLYTFWSFSLTNTASAPPCTHRFAQSRELASPFPFEAPHEASLIQPTIDPAEAIEAAKTVAQNIFPRKRIVLFYGFLAVTAVLFQRPICKESEMPDTKTPTKDDAAESRPVPSQAEGDEKTIDESLRQKEQKDRK